MAILAPTMASAATTTSTAAVTATSAKPAAGCPTPTLTVSPGTAAAGSKVTVSGKNFSGCAAQGSSAKPTAVIPVKVGILTASKVSEVLASTQTSSDGSFSVTVTVPALPTGGVSKVAIAAVAQDPATMLDYLAISAINYPAATGTATTPSSTMAPTTQMTSSMASDTTSEQPPTAVPAGSGGQGASGTSSDAGLAVGAAGLLLVGAGALALSRRRSARQH